MIIPFLDGFLRFSRAPVTWLLILLNVFFFSQNYQLSKGCQEQFQAWYDDQDFLYTQGQVYKQFNKDRSLASISDNELIGRLAFKDEGFLSIATTSDWLGDQVAIKSWKSDLNGFMALRAYYPPLMFGVSDSQDNFFSYISYQFFHEGFYHLLGNVLLILLVGGFLERRFPGLLIFGVYLVGGGLSALFYSFSSSMSGAPLVGASGSLCALLGFLFITHLKKKTRLFYMVLPAKGYMGFVFIPTVYWVLWLCMIEDVSGWISQPILFSSGVAHLVHLFGFMVGALLGYLQIKKFPQWVRKPQPLSVGNKLV